MALKNNISTKFGINSYDVIGEYTKILNIKDQKIETALYASQKARNGGATFMQKFYYTAPSSYFDEEVLKEDGKSALNQAYLYLKTIDVFSGSTDI